MSMDSAATKHRMGDNVGSRRHLIHISNLISFKKFGSKPFDQTVYHLFVRVDITDIVVFFA